MYSYGVVLLELITRQKVLDPLLMERTGNMDLVSWVRSTWRDTEELEKIVDDEVLDEIDDTMIREQVENVLLVALRCTKWEATRRPSMREVVKCLEDTKSSFKSIG